MRPPVLACALVLASGALLACSSCPPQWSTTSLPGGTLTLDAATPQVSRQLFVSALAQHCGCTWCGPASLSLALSGQVAWPSPSGEGALPVVRFTLTPGFTTDDSDTLAPALPLDVVLTPAAPSAAPSIQVAHVCPGTADCSLTYGLRIARVDAAPASAVDVTWSLSATYASQDAPILTVSP